MKVRGINQVMSGNFCRFCNLAERAALVTNFRIRLTISLSDWFGACSKAAIHEQAGQKRLIKSSDLLTAMIILRFALMLPNLTKVHSTPNCA